MSVWPDLVTTALLGTGRRPVPDLTPANWTLLNRTGAAESTRRSDPAERVLDLAAAHASVARLHPLPRCAAPEVGPPPDLPLARGPARRLLEEMLRRPEPKLVNLWVRACARHGYGLAPEHWTAVVRLAVRSPHYDRDPLGIALGERGRWFLAQNPQWRRLDDDLRARAAQAPVPDPSPTDATVDLSRLEAAPEMIFDIPDPWPPAVVAAAFRLLGGGRLGPRARSYAVGVGVRLPPATYGSIGQAAEYYLQAPEASPALRRAVRAGFVALERAAFARLQVDRAFDSDLAELRRVEIPPV